MSRNEKIGLFVAGILFAIVLAVILLLKLIDTAQAIQIIISFVLVLITSIYVKRTADIADATRWQAKATRQQAEATLLQADASVRMAEEMREQRIMASRPVIIQKAVPVSETEFATFGADWFSHFEICNAGSGPAIEVETSLLNEDKSLRQSHRESFLRAGETPLEFSPTGLVDLQGITFYLVTEYQSILSRQAQHIWYQTWLPFKLSKATKEGEVYVVAGELEFKEASEKERIDAFGSRSKPK